MKFNHRFFTLLWLFLAALAALLVVHLISPDAKSGGYVRSFRESFKKDGDELGGSLTPSKDMDLQRWLNQNKEKSKAGMLVYFKYNHKWRPGRLPTTGILIIIMINIIDNFRKNNNNNNKNRQIRMQ